MELRRRESGFTMVELLVGVGILTVIMSTVGMSLSHALGTQQGVIDDGRAMIELRKGLSWFAEDIRKASTSDLADGAPAVSNATFMWTDEYNDAGINHTSGYNLAGAELVRTYDGAAHTVARNVVSASFSKSGSKITLQLEIDAGEGTTRSHSLSPTLGATP